MSEAHRSKKGVSRGEARYGSAKAEAERAKLNDTAVAKAATLPEPNRKLSRPKTGEIEIAYRRI